MTDQQRKFLRASVALSFYEVYSRRPTSEELELHVKKAELYSRAIAATLVKDKISRTLTF